MESEIDAAPRMTCPGCRAKGTLHATHTDELPDEWDEGDWQTAVKKAAAEYLNEAEDHGFSPDVCGYVKADYALQLRGGEHPRGRIPRPSMAVLTNACNTYIKWAEIWERHHEEGMERPRERGPFGL